MFTDEQGRVLYDLPRGARPNADVAAPVRFLPRYDELLIAYQHRDRLIAPAHRPKIYTNNGIVEAVVLVDGFAAGTWSVARAKTEAILGIAPFARLGARERAAVEVEGRELLAFVAPDATTVGVRFA
jgi:winged helix DNA-binding protein